MRLSVGLLCLAAAALSPALPARATGEPRCTQIGWTDVVTGPHELFEPCGDRDDPLTCTGAFVGPVVGGPLDSTEVHVWVCVPKPASVD